MGMSVGRVISSVDMVGCTTWIMVGETLYLDRV